MLWLMAVPARPAAWLSEAMERAQQTSGLKWECIAALMNRTATQLSRQKLGHHHFSFHDFLSLAETEDGKAFGRALLIEVAAVFDLTDLDAAGVLLNEAIHSYARLRMAKSTLYPAARERKSA